MKIKVFIFLTAILFFACKNDGIIAPSEKLTDIPILDFEISHDDYVNLLLNETNNYEVPVTLRYNNELFSADIRASGAGSRFHPKWSYRVKITDNSLLEGKKEFNLSSQVYDQTMIRNTLTSHLYKQLGFDVFESRHVFVRINHKDEGLYPMIERVDEDFFASRNIPVYQLYKLGFDSQFTFTQLNNPRFNFEKKIPDDENYSVLYDFIHAIDTSNAEKLTTSLGKFLDIDEYIRYHAITSLINNIDAFTNNLYIYKKYPDAPFKLIPWDFDKSFDHRATDKLVGNNDIIRKLFKNKETFEKYKQEIHFQLDHYFNERNMFRIIDSTASVIESAYNMDPYLGKGRYDFYSEIEELKLYIKDRINYFENNIDSITQDYMDIY